MQEYHTRFPNATSTSNFHKIKEFPINESLLLGIIVLGRFGLTVAAATSVEFFMAQAPCQIRGLVVSMLTASSSIFYILRAILLHVTHDVRVFHVQPFQIVTSVLMLGLFPLFVFASKRYKLRKRDDIIPYHLFAEEQFERDYQRGREWWRERENFE